MEKSQDKIEECKKCKKKIFDSYDKLEYKGKIYCPSCYAKALKGPDVDAGKTLGNIVLILVIIVGICLTLIVLGFLGIIG